MPEGPELHLSTRYVNSVCKNRIFGGKPIKSEVSRQEAVEWEAPRYTIFASSRGKEVKLTLTPQPDAKNDRLQKNQAKKPGILDIVFQFGMSGKFQFYEAGKFVKHSHLNFYTLDEPKMVLGFVDFRRFGRWQVGGKWSEKRGPCPLSEYPKFRENVLSNLKKPIFNKGICEVMLNQQYFNGIGNYLRAEILYRLKIPPFVSARSVLMPLVEKTANDTDPPKVKKEGPDILQLCNLVPLEVVNLGGTSYDPEERDEHYSVFLKWLQCYYNPKMNNMVDHHNRTIWYSGPAGPLAPTEVKVRAKIKFQKKRKNKETEDEAETKKIKLEKKSTSEKVGRKEKKVKSKKSAAEGDDVSHEKQMKKEPRKKKIKLEKESVQEKNENDASDLKVSKHASLTDLKLSDYPTDGSRITRKRVKTILKGAGLKQKSSQKVDKKVLQDEFDPDGDTAAKIKKRAAQGKKGNKQK